MHPLVVQSGVAFVVDGLVGGAWQQAIPISVPAGDNAASPRLATGPDHNPVVGWIDTGMLGFARWTGAKWDARASLISDPGGIPISTVFNIVVDARGSVWLAWSPNEISINVWMSNY